MKNTGVWLDKNKALIVTLENDTESFKSVASNIEHIHEQGGAGKHYTRNPLNVIKEKSNLEREKQQLRAYFKEIVPAIDDTDALVIFGPAETGKKFSKELQQRYKYLSSKIIDVKRADSMTDNQVKAWVRDFFRSN